MSWQCQMSFIEKRSVLSLHYIYNSIYNAELIFIIYYYYFNVISILLFVQIITNQVMWSSVLDDLLSENNVAHLRNAVCIPPLAGL